MRLMMRIALLLSASALAADAQTGPAFPDFSSSAGLKLTGSAAVREGVLRLTQAQRHLAGAAWLEQKVTVSNGFDATFQFRLTHYGGLGGGADGLAFVLQNNGPDALGGRGSAGGFALGDPHYYHTGPGIPRSIAVFFDTFHNGETHDPSDNYVGIFNAGTPQAMRWPPPRLAYATKLRTRLKNGKTHAARILYQPPVISVWLDDYEVLSTTVDLHTVMDTDGSAYVGFTASTGNGYENHDILSWSLTRPEVTSNLSVVSSEISFQQTACLPGRNLCTPEQAVVQETGPGMWHVVLPANAEWGASVPNVSGRPVAIQNARGLVCWNLRALGAGGCNGPAGNASGTGRLISRTSDGRTWFSVDDRTGNFRDNEGYFEFDVRVQ
jgi:hypothetical protein